MIPSTLFALVVVLSSLATVNGAVVQRDGTFTYITPQPTASGQQPSTTTTTTRPSSTTSTTVTTSVTATTPTTTSSLTATIPATTTPATTSTPITTTSATTTPTTATTPTQTTTVSTVTSPSFTTPTTTSTPVPNPSGAANCNGVQQWLPSFAYSAGDRVIFNGQLFTARQWTFNNSPPAHLDQWIPGGACSQPINNQANCNGVAAWQTTVAYTSGNRVTFNGHLWSAVQWVQSNVPGDASGSWKDEGACA